MAQKTSGSGCCGCLVLLFLASGIVAGFQSCNTSSEKSSTPYCRKVYIGDGRGNGEYQEVCK